MNKPQTIANTIQSMMIDINAEVVIADLIELGYDSEKLLVKHDGLFKRNFSKDRPPSLLPCAYSLDGIYYTKVFIN